MKTKQLKIGKYIILNGRPILFPLEILHSDVATHGQTAGFFVLRVNDFSTEVYCWGESTSLNLQSNQENDARIIREFIRNVSMADEQVFTQHRVMEK